MGGSEMMVTNAPSVLRNFVYDSRLCDPLSSFEALDLVAPSEEGHTMELGMSVGRVEAVENLLPLIATYASVAGGMVAVNVSSRQNEFAFHNPDAPLEDLAEAFTGYMTTAVMGAMTALVAGLHHMGVLPSVVIHYADEFPDE